MSEHILWVEKYRPHKIEDCILPDALKNTFQEYVNRKEIPNLLFAGSAGVGKTTVARALCEEVGCDYIVINGSEENGVDTIRIKIRNYASSMSLMGGRKVVILDEPTAALGVAQTEQVLQLVRRLADAGKAVIIISHNLQDVFSVADRIYVLYLGKMTAAVKKSETSQADVVAYITGTKTQENVGA